MIDWTTKINKPILSYKSNKWYISIVITIAGCHTHTMDDKHNEEIVKAQQDAAITRAVARFCALYDMDKELVGRVHEEQLAFNDPPDPPLWYGQFLDYLETVD